MRWFLRLGIPLLILVGAIYAGLNYLRPVVVVDTVRRGTVVDAPPGTITVMAQQSPTVRAEVDGRVLRTAIKLGAEVKAGDLLVELDPASTLLQIERLEADLATAKRRLEVGPTGAQGLAAAQEALRLAEIDFQRGSVPEVALNAARREAARAEQAVELDRIRLEQDVATTSNELELARLRLKRMKIFAGIDGTIVQTLIGPDDQVSPGMPVAQINSRERRVEMLVSEEDVAKLKPGQKARVQFQPYPFERFDGEIDQILPPLDSGTQRYRVLLKVDIPQERLLHGMTGEGFVKIAEIADALIVPRAAITDEKVFVVRFGRVREQKIKIGFKSIHEVEVKEGLEEGDVVVIDGLDSLRDGDRVKTKPRPKA
ncbi:MAG: efflux RND transporter periplasmic adaptor subunit [Opitutaceae bacterium]|nr:efflux RND transporter periplasmic adaptor subunit [Opitutaceae bacterium]